MYAKEKNFDAFCSKANAETGLQIGIFKAIIATESGFEPNFKSAFEPRKYGLMGITELAISRIAKASQEDFGRVEPADLMDPEVNIRIGAKLLRYLYATMDNPNLMEVAAEWCALNASGHPGIYVNKFWAAYWHYSQLAGEPASIMPNEVPGVEIRKQEMEWGRL